MRPHVATSPVRSLLPGVLALSIVALGACNLQLSTDVEAKDQWTRTYPLTAEGELVLTTSNGRIEITGGDTDKVVVTAERIVRAATEEVANEQLRIFEMKEEIAPNRVSIDSSSKDVSLNVRRTVSYTVTLPRTAAVTLHSRNGEIRASNIGGHFAAESTNGRITATGLQQSANVSTTNGVIALTFDQLGGEGIRADTTNGTITVSIPSTANADLSARVTNGAITHEGLDLQVSETSRRRLDGRLGAGGLPIRLETTNGTITVKGLAVAK